MSETVKGPGWWLASDGQWYPPDLLPDEEAQRVQPRGAESSQGPGWWLASDGKWYPPELRQAAAQERVAESGSPVSGGPGWWEASDRLWYPPQLRAQKEVSEEPESRKPTAEAPTASKEPTRPAEPTRPLVVGRRPGRRFLPVGILAVIVAVGVLIGVLVSSGSSNPSSPASQTPSAVLSATGGWESPGERVVGGPVVAEGRVLAIVVTATRATELDAMDPTTGRVLWHAPYSLSDINAGIPLMPIYATGTVLDLAPSGQATDPSVKVEGIDLTTGATRWTLGTSAMVVDPPQLCSSPSLFCVDDVTASGSPALQLINPASGEVHAVVPGPSRQLSHDLYQVDTSPQSVAMVDSSGHVSWTVAVSNVFAGSQFSPDNGFNIEQVGGNYVGSVGASLSGTTVPLHEYETVALRSANGGVAWTTAGSYQCLGALRISAPFVCRYSSDARLVGERLTVDGTSLTLAGIDTASGAVTWSKAVRDAQSLTDGQGLPQADGSLVVVTLTSGARVLLDLSSGVTSPVPPNDTFWCATQQMVIPIAPPAALVDGARDGVPTYTACSASGSPLTTIPNSVPNSVGVTAGGFFVWSSPGGLRGLRRAH